MQTTALAKTKEWHDQRRLGVGGSDCAAALGMSKWKTPYQLYLEKIGEAEPQDETWDMARGAAMEPLLRQHFADTFSVAITVPGEAVVHPKYAFMRYNPDGLCRDASGIFMLAEFKTARYATGWGQPGTDEVPHEYLLQVQHGMACLPQYEVARPSVSIGFGEPVYYEVPANKELQEMIIEQEAEFWQRVQDRNPPEPTINEDVARRYRNVTCSAVTATDGIIQANIKLRSLREDIRRLESEKEIAEVFIKSFMGGHDVLIDENGVLLCTWKARKGAVRLNSKALKEDKPDLWEEYAEEGEPGRTFLVK